MKVQKCYFVLEGQKLTDYFCYITIVLLRKQEYASNYWKECQSKKSGLSEYY